MTTKISYARSDEAWVGYENFITETIEKNDAKRICDIGGGANPLLSADYIHKKDLAYAILDISKVELDKAPENYTKILADIASPSFSQPTTKYDLVFSMMLAEHVKDGEQFHKNIFNMLNENGLAIHFFPTLYTLPFVVNYLVPEAVADKILQVVQPRDRHQHEKFPAYYSWCRGPALSQLKRFEALGYEVLEYKGFYGHGEYYKRVPFIRRLHERTADYLVKQPNPLFTSYAYVVLKRAAAKIRDVKPN